MLAWSPTRLKIRSSPPGPADERQQHEPRPEGEHGDASEAEEQHDDQRRAEDRAARGDRGDRERQHRDRIDEPERDDRKADRFQAEPNAAEPSQRRDLDDIVEPERQHHAARSRGAAGRQAATSVGPLAGEQALPAEGAEDEAREIRPRGTEHEDDVRLLQRPARARQTPRGEERRPRWRARRTPGRQRSSADDCSASVSCARQDEECDRCVLARDGNDHEGVKELVVAEHVRGSDPAGAAHTPGHLSCRRARRRPGAERRGCRCGRRSAAAR